MTPIPVIPKQLQQHPANEKNPNRARIIALKVMVIAGIVIGSIAALGGAAALTFFAVTSPIFAPALTIGIIVAGHILAFTCQLLKNEVTALGAAFTLPMAGVCAGFPFLLPIAIGGAPGGALIALSAWGWEQIKD